MTEKPATRTTASDEPKRPAAEAQIPDLEPRGDEEQVKGGAEKTIVGEVSGFGGFEPK